MTMPTPDSDPETREHTGHSEDQEPTHTTDTASPPPMRKSRFPVIALVRTVWLTIVAVGKVVVFITAGPDTDPVDQTARWNSQIGLAADSYEANELLTQGAPQQSVANGWHTNELLELQAEIAASSSEASQTDIRTIALLVMLLGVGLLGDRALRVWDRPKETRSMDTLPTT